MAFDTLGRVTRKALTPLICQDTCSGGLGAVLAHAEVCHNALVEFTGKEAFEASNDLALGPAIGGAACDVVDGRLVEPHPGDDGSIEGSKPP